MGRCKDTNFIFEWRKHYFTNERMVYIKSSSICSNTSKMGMGSKGGAVVRALASHQCGPGSNPGIDGIMSVEFVVGSLPFSDRCFPGYTGFHLSLKTNTSEFQFDLVH